MAAFVLASVLLAGQAQPLDKPIYLESLAPPSPNYDANTGQYRRTITVPTIMWPGKPAADIKDIKPFEARNATTPAFQSYGYSMGQSSSGRITGGGMETWQDAVRSGPVVLVIFGGLMLAAGIVLALWAKQIALGIAIAGAGLMLIVTGILFESYPWIAILAMMCVLGVGGWWLWNNRKLSDASTALAAVAGAAEVNPSIKPMIAEAAKSANVETLVRNAVRRVKNTTKAKKAKEAAEKAAAEQVAADATSAAALAQAQAATATAIATTAKE